jgi:hypothetical protein
MPKVATLLSLFALLMPCAASAQVPPAYHATMLGYGTALAMNNQGQVVGVDDNSPKVWSRTGVATLLPGTVYQASVSDINDDGTVVGHGVLSNPDVGGYYQPLVWPRGGNVQRIAVPGEGGITFGINRHGHILGSIVAPDGWPDTISGFLQRESGTVYFDGFYPQGLNDVGDVVGSGFHGITVWRDGELYEVPQGCCGYAHDINNNGWIIGSDLLQDGFYAGLWKEGEFTAMWKGFPSDINDAGMVVGESNYSKAVLWYEGRAYLLDHLWSEPQWLDWSLTRAVAINEKGEIAAQAENIANGGYAIFLLSPVPEPAIAWMLLLGLTLIGFGRRRPCYA